MFGNVLHFKAQAADHHQFRLMPNTKLQRAQQGHKDFLSRRHIIICPSVCFSKWSFSLVPTLCQENELPSGLPSMLLSATNWGMQSWRPQRSCLRTNIWVAAHRYFPARRHGADIVSLFHVHFFWPPPLVCAIEIVTKSSLLLTSCKHQNMSNPFKASFIPVQMN